MAGQAITVIDKISSLAVWLARCSQAVQALPIICGPARGSTFDNKRNTTTPESRRQLSALSFLRVTPSGI